MSWTSSLKTTHLYCIRPRNRLLETDAIAIPHSVLSHGAEHVSSSGGTGQHSGHGMGASACGIAASNFVRVAFSIEQGGLQDPALLQAVLGRKSSEVGAS